MMATLFTFENLHRAWLDCRRRKRGKPAALAFEANAEEELLRIAFELAGRNYRPRPSFCFVARNDKYREVFAAQFRDRVVHHLLVRELEKAWEPVFIHDSYACRKGKGSLAAVERLQTFMRKATANLKTQFGFFHRRFHGVILFHVGKYFELFDRDAVWASGKFAMKKIPVRAGFYARCGVHRTYCRLMEKRLSAAQRNILIVAQQDMPHGALISRMGIMIILTNTAYRRRAGLYPQPWHQVPHRSGGG